MKRIFTLLCIAVFSCLNLCVQAQESLESFNDYKNLTLSNTDTIPGFATKDVKLKISGTIYQSDGVTPAKDIILYIEQANEHGDFNVIKEGEKRYLENRGWIKTDADGKYTFYTYIPGGDRRYKLLQQLFPIIKEPSKKEVYLESFLFDEDPLLTKLCRKRIAKKGDPSRILKLKKQDKLFVVEKNIILGQEALDTK